MKLRVVKLLRLAILSALAPVLCAALSSCQSPTECDAPVGDEFKQMLDSVVKIDVWETVQKDGGNRISRAIGSGVIMDERGTVLTNAHVANIYTTKIMVTLSNLERVKAEFVGWDHWSDLAVIRLDTADLERRGIKFSHAKFGDSNKLALGEVVYAVGTPHGFARTLTRGIVSNTRRFFEGTLLNDSGYETGLFNTWIQTDAAINPGNSGGPLVSGAGEVVGINTRAYLNSNNLGFSVPSNVAKSVMEKLVKSGVVERSYVGISLAPLQDMENFFDLAANKGALVRNVDTRSPAATAGFLSGDIILKIDGREIDGRFPEQLPAIMNLIAKLPVGEDVKIEAIRSGKIFERTLKTERQESRVGVEFALEKWGVGIREITEPFAREIKLESESRLMVIGLRQSFPFDIAKIAGGDIIVSINRKKVSSSAELKKVYAELSKKKDKIMIEVLRDHEISYHIVSQDTEI